MTEKFSYYDLLAYLVPGTVVVWATIQLAEKLGILQLIATGSTLLDASAFVVIAFMAGHLVQAEAQRRLDTSHRYSVFPDGLPSSSFLVCGEKDDKGKPWCSDSRRLAYIAAARRHGFLDDKQVDTLKTAPPSEEELRQAKQASQDVYRAAFSLLTDTGRAQKAITAKQTYGLFRGLAMTCAVVVALFCIVLIVGLIRSFGSIGEQLGTWRGFTELLLYPVLVVIAFSYAAVSFRLRARNRGKHHAREVFDALLSAPTLDQEDTPGEGAESQTDGG